MCPYCSFNFPTKANSPKRGDKMKTMRNEMKWMIAAVSIYLLFVQLRTFGEIKVHEQRQQTM